MQMDPDKVRKLQQMGLGPVWQRRGLAAEESGSVSAATALPASASAEEAADAASVMSMDWATLEENIRGCSRCGLCQGRTHAVPGVGDHKARWLFVGEGPGHQEDAQGEPFVGPAGKLLDNMLRALGLNRGANTYIANIVKCRPIAADGRDRPPTADEIAACMPYLERQIDLIQPDVIVALGQTAAVALLGLPTKTSLASLREEVHDRADIPLIATYHPAYLLREPTEKAKSWQDLCLAMSLVNGR